MKPYFNLIEKQDKSLEYKGEMVWHPSRSEFSIFGEKVLNDLSFVSSEGSVTGFQIAAFPTGIAKTRLPFGIFLSANFQRLQFPPGFLVKYCYALSWKWIILK